MATPEEIAQIQSRLSGLTSEQKQELMGLIQSRRPREPEFSPYFAGGEKPIPRPEAIPGMPFSPDNPIADAMAAGMGTVATVGAPLAGAGGALASGGIGAGAKALLPIAKRGIVGAGIGAAVGGSPIPVVGNIGATEGAKLGAMVGTGQGGVGALWKHGKRRGLIEWLINKVAGGGDEAVGAVDDLASAAAQRGMSTSAGIARGTSAARATVPAEGGRDAIIAADRARRALRAEEAVAQARNIRGVPPPPQTPPASVSSTLGPQAAPAPPPALARTPPAPAAPAAAAAPGAAPEATEIVNQMQTWRNAHKFSDAQILSSLREIYGVSMPDGRRLLQMLN